MVEPITGNQHRRSANRNCWTNSPPYGYGGLRADTMVLPVRIIMSPTSSSRPLAGRNARSATLLTTLLLSPTSGEGSQGYATAGLRLKREPSPLLAQTGEEDDVDPSSALQVSGSQHALLREAGRPGQTSGV